MLVSLPDNLHFDTASQLELGKRYAQELIWLTF